MPMTENIVQTAKLTVKANVFIARTEYCLRVSKAVGPPASAREAGAAAGAAPGPAVGLSFMTAAFLQVEAAAIGAKRAWKALRQIKQLSKKGQAAAVVHGGERTARIGARAAPKIVGFGG
jgi:hypothetical protein